MAKFTYIAGRFIVAGDRKPAGLRLVFDVEANGLMEIATTVHCIVIADLDSDRIDTYGPEQINAALDHLARADYLTGHNITGYDLPLLRRLHGWRSKTDCSIVDTLVTGRLILPNVADLDDQAAGMGDPPLGKFRGRYSLEAWGKRLGIPKTGTDITDWSTWTPQMQERCGGDVVICKALWRFLQPDGYSREAIELEHRVATICDAITATGVPFDITAAERLREQWTARYSELETQLARQFPGVNLSSRPQIGALLEARGWVPERRTEKTQQPKIDDELLETIPALYPEFAGLGEHFTLGRRLAQLAHGKKAWCKAVAADGRSILHIGTPHSRAKHLEPNLAQVPNPKKGTPFGAECRALFQARDDWMFVTTDQAGLQDRGFAHYLSGFDAGAYARTFADEGGDTHWQSSTALGLVSTDTARNKDGKVHTAIREGAKRFRYAFLFGAGAARAGRIVYDITRGVHQIDADNDLQHRFFGGLTHPNEAALKRVGRQALDKFEAATPGLRRLRERLQIQARKHGWLPGLDGRRVPVRALHSALNFIVTSSEAIICKRWLMRVHEELCTKFRYGWDGDVVIVLWVHDEIACCCRPEIAEQVGEIMVRHAKEAGEFYNFKVPLDAEYKIGRSWAGEPQAVTQADLDTINTGLKREGIEPLKDLPRHPPTEAPEITHHGPLHAVEFETPTTPDAKFPLPPPELDDPPPRSNGHAGNGFDNYAAGEKPPSGSHFVAAWVYLDADKRPHMRVSRMEDDEGKKTYPTQYWKGDGWVYGWPDEVIPYRLPELLAAKDVFIAEGEKGADKVAALGLDATTSPGGAGKWPTEFADHFRHVERVTIFEDNDAAGRDHTKKILASLRGVVPHIAVVAFPELSEKDDVANWLDAGGNKQLLLARAAEAHKRSQVTAPFPFVNTSRWRTREPPEREWVVPDRIPRRQVALFSGEGAAGKSTILLHECAAHPLAGDWLGVVPMQGPTFFIDVEDDEDEIWRRLACVARYYDVPIADILDRGLHISSLVGDDAVLATTTNKSGKVEPTPRYYSLLEAVADVKPIMIGIASSACVFAGNENDRSQVQQFVNLLTKFAIVANGAVQLVSHPSLTGISTDTGLSGTTQWHNAVRARAYLKGIKPENGEQPDNDLREIVFKKNQYGRVAESILLRYQDGLYLPLEGIGPIDAVAKAAIAEDVFLTLLKRFTDENRHVGANIGPGYAPAAFAREDEAKKAGVSKINLEAAMRQLFKDNKIRNEPYGKPSRIRYRIAVK